MKKENRKGWPGRAVKWLTLAITLLSAAFLLFACVQVFELDALQDFDPDKILDVDQTLIFYDANNQEITRLHGAENRINIDIQSLPSHVTYAFIAAEDARFYAHPGVDVIRIFGAAWADLKAGSYVQGASTISQQLIKLSHLTAEKTMSRKLEEAVLAYRMEQIYSKDEILEMYLNYVYFGGGYYGIETAAQGYFGVPARALTTAQAAMLAGILKSPSAYAPHLDLEASIRRRDMVLGLMEEYGFISAEVCAEARAEKPHILHGTANYRRGYYVDAAFLEAARVLGLSTDELLTGGYRVYTAMDTALQARCEAAMEKEALFPAADVQAAVVVQHAGSGFVAALVGGRGESAAFSLNRATDIRRQPGSLIKPVLCYAPALEHGGYTAATMLLDEQTTFGDYTPGNFGAKYYGWVTLRQAATKSLNVPAVRLLSELGVENAKAFAAKMGIVFDETDSSLTLALGGFTYGVSPMMMAGAYNCFASGGVYHTPCLVRAITDAEGTPLYDAATAGERVMREQNAYILNSMLQSVVREGTGRRLGELEMALAGKTGTVGESEENRDAWMAAYNPEYTAVVWMGYDSAADGALPKEATGGKYPALLLGELFAYLYSEREAPEFTAPKGVVTVKLDAYSLQNRHTAALATALTPTNSILEEVFTAGSEPDTQSEYWTVPLPAGNFAVSMAEAYPKIEFTPRQSEMTYKLYRRDQAGAVQCVGEWRGSRARVAYLDKETQAGMRYSYYVVPEHPALSINGKRITGPASATYTVETPAILLGKREKTPEGAQKNAESETAPLDLTGIS